MNARLFALLALSVLVAGGFLLQKPGSSPQPATAGDSIAPGTARADGSGHGRETSTRSSGRVEIDATSTEFVFVLSPECVPVANVQWSLCCNERQVAGFSDGDGRLSVSPPCGPGVWSAATGSYRTLDPGIEVEGPGPHMILVERLRPFTLEIVNRDGKPIEGACVRVSERDDSWGSRDIEQCSEYESDEFGIVRIEAPADPHAVSVHVFARGYRAAIGAVAEFGEESLRSRIVLTSVEEECVDVELAIDGEEGQSWIVYGSPPSWDPETHPYPIGMALLGEPISTPETTDQRDFYARIIGKPGTYTIDFSRSYLAEAPDPLRIQLPELVPVRLEHESDDDIATLGMRWHLDQPEGTVRGHWNFVDPPPTLYVPVGAKFDWWVIRDDRTIAGGSEEASLPITTVAIGEFSHLDDRGRVQVISPVRLRREFAVECYENSDGSGPASWFELPEEYQDRWEKTAVGTEAPFRYEAMVSKEATELRVTAVNGHTVSIVPRGEWNSEEQTIVLPADDRVTCELRAEDQEGRPVPGIELHFGPSRGTHPIVTPAYTAQTVPEKDVVVTGPQGTVEVSLSKVEHWLVLADYSNFARWIDGDATRFTPSQGSSAVLPIDHVRVVTIELDPRVDPCGKSWNLSPNRGGGKDFHGSKVSMLVDRRCETMRICGPSGIRSLPIEVPAGSEPVTLQARFPE